MKKNLLRKLNMSKSGKFKAWQNEDGDWCLGNKCFRMRAADDGVHVAFNPDGKNCPKNLQQALKQISNLAGEGKPTKYSLPKAVKEEW